MSSTLLDVISDMARRRELAARTNTNPSYLWQIATGRRRASPDLARDIEREASEMGESVPKESLRADLWAAASEAKRHRRKAS